MKQPDRLTISYLEKGIEGKFVMTILRNIHITFMASAVAFIVPSQGTQAADLGCSWPCYEQTGPQPIHRTLTKRVEIEPGAYEIARDPSLYGWVEKKVVVSRRYSWKDDAEPIYRTEKKRILLRPYKNIAIYHRAQHEYVREHVTIRPESTNQEPHSRYYSHKDW